MLAGDFAHLAAGALLLWFGATWIVDSASALARRLNISDLVIGLTVVALGTSAPEFTVTVTAAFKNLADISLSNIVGSNIFNLGFILGLVALVKPVPTHRTILYRDGLLLWGVTGMILIMALDLYVGRIAGMILVGTLAAYLTALLTRSRALIESVELPSERKARWWDVPRLMAGFIAIAFGGDMMVEGAASLAAALGVGSWAVGVTVVAAGTSLPEMITCLVMVAKGKNDMLLGNLLGSDFFNLAGVLGLTCLIRPLTVSPSALPSLYMLVGMVLVVLIFVRTGWRLSRKEGFVLVAANLARWYMDLSG